MVAPFGLGLKGDVDEGFLLDQESLNSERRAVI